MTALRILILSDGRPGHYRQSEAIATALARKRETVVEKFELPAPAFLPRALVPKLAAALPSPIYLRLVHGLNENDFPQADLVVSAGAATFGASLALKRFRGTPNVIAGSLRGIDPHEISLTLLPYARARDLPNHACLIKPAMIDPDTLPAPKPWTGMQAAKDLSIGVLIGGSTKAVSFDTPDWTALARLLAALGEQGLRLIVSTSPRTPQAAYDALAALEDSKRLELIDFRTAGPGSNAGVFACDGLLVTLDSMSMITEAVAAQRPTIALAPRVTRPHADNEAVETLVHDDCLRVIELAQASPAAIDDAFSAITPMRENHLDVLAETVLARIAV